MRRPSWCITFLIKIPFFSVDGRVFVYGAGGGGGTYIKVAWAAAVRYLTEITLISLIYYSRRPAPGRVPPLTPGVAARGRKE